MKASVKKEYKKDKARKAIKELERLSKKELEYRCTHCPKCDKKIVPDRKAVRFGTKKWDEHTYMLPCKCLDSNLRYSVG